MRPAGATMGMSVADDSMQTHPHEEDLMAQITVLTKDDIAARRRDLLDEAGLTLDELHERAASYILSPEQAVILKELDDLEFLARA